ncbi:hypothetical protein [Thiohalomonas denitrificans]|uniref:Uncharacterized protein n=1 Tax=Thiohalomonas denitrificans TaxID=415747 RepID=A0A1G5Q306_9GAMM|nr:hypothetical protein [Thiohalomonas denitrificans]SCZ56244.1 hypothetical protein SAMN03097708_01315 [Thiohalomonas denitrificans]
MRQLIGAILMVILSGGVQAACLHVTENGFEVDEREVASSVSWHAVIENECEVPYDADLTVVFNDEEGEHLYDVQDLVTVGRGEAVEAGKKIYMPSQYLPRIAEVDISIEERERPF